MNRLEKAYGDLEIKTAANDKGAFEGYVSIFGNKDHDGDIIVEGAFKEIKTTRDGKLKMLLFHNTELPIAAADFAQDSKGIHVKGDFDMESKGIKQHYSSIKSGVIDQASVGFNINPGGRYIGKDAAYITDATLWEGSLVTFGANESAGLTSVKSLQGVDAKAFTRFLRDTLKCSQKEATAIACHGFKGLEHCYGVDDPTADMAAFKELMQSFKIS